jgi:HlyD family secretion protein
MTLQQIEDEGRDDRRRWLARRILARYDGRIHIPPVDRGRPEMFARICERLFNVTAAVIALVVLSSYLVASYELQAWPFAEQRSLRERYHLHRVSRTRLEPFLSAPGRVESSRRTIVRCELENMAAAGGVAATTGSSTAIWLIPEGSEVKKGDVLARLDSSTYDEMLRQQEIVVEQAKASHLQAQLDHEIAKIALREYMDGLAKETAQEMEAAVALARSNLTQAGERLEWTVKMKDKGYASVAQTETDKQTYMTMDLQLQRQLGAYDLFKRFTLPKTQKTLEADITTSQTTLDSEQVKLNRQLERLALLKRQVERCTIRAPHDGVVYYYFNSNQRPGSQETQVEEGMAVRQEQKLFFLPDLSEMEIQVILNESVVDRVGTGLRGTVEFDALPRLSIGGTITSVGQIPNRENQRGEDIRYFIGTLKLDRSEEGLKPGMSAVVTFELPSRQGILALPHEAVIADADAPVCYVAAGENLERRDVKIGQATTDLIEITDGLTEGEEVVLDPPGQTSRPRTLAGFDSRPLPKEAFIPAPAAKFQPSGRSQGAFGTGGERRKGNGPPGGAARKSRKKSADAE